MIKVHKHPLVCDCGDCASMFPPGRFEAVWVAPEPAGAARRAVGRVPIGHPRPALEVGLWVADGRLAADWPGFPGTVGAHVELAERAPGEAPLVVATRDPILSALAPPVPLRRALVDRFNARSMVDHGLAPEDSADFVACARHGHGIGALSCACIIEAAAPREAALVYGLDGDYPDLFCMSCLTLYAGGDVDVCRTVCSRCQQERAYFHHIAATTWYGA